MEKNHKCDFRKSCIKRLEFVSRFSKTKTDKKIVDNLYRIIHNLQAKKVLLYLPMGMEVDILPLISMCIFCGFMYLNK